MPVHAGITDKMASRDDSALNSSSRSNQMRKSATFSNVSSASLLADRSLNSSALNTNGTRTPKSKRSSTSSTTRTPRLGKSPGGAPVYDRYIPKRSSSASNLSASIASLSLKGLEDSVFQDGDSSPRSTENRKNLSQALLGEKKDRILEFRAKPPPAPEGSVNPFSSLYTHSIAKSGAVNAKKIPRAIPTAPMRILDAPDLINDYYLTRIDWGSANLLAVALGPSVYLWDGETAEIAELFTTESHETEERYIASVSWLQGSNFLAVGNKQAEVQVWDAALGKKIRTMRGHTGRTGCLDWNDHVIASGSRSGSIHYHDVRVPDHFFCYIKAHEQEVCGLKWSPDKRYLASGGNDNLLNIWPFPNEKRPADFKYDKPVHSFNLHQAAIKAIAWCPWQPSVVASGGGLADRTIKLWNINMGSLLTSKDTGSQVSGIVWSEEYRELVTGHGFAKNELILWKYPSFERMAELTGHTDRILDLCQSSDKSLVVSAGADETIRIWGLFPVDNERKKKKQQEEMNTSVLSRQCIR